MRLVHAITSVDLRLGGTARAALDLVQAMTRREHQVTLLTNDASDVPQSWIGGGNPQSLLDPGLASYLVASRPSAATVEAVRDADVVHIHAMWEPFNARIATLCRKIGTPYVLTPHGMLDDWCMARGAWKKRVYLKLFGRQMLESAAFVHCTARAELDQSARWFPKGRGIVVPNLMDLSPFAELPGPSEARARWPRLGEHDVRLLFLGRLNPKKGVEHLIDATAQLVADGIDAVAMVAGPADGGYGDKLSAYARARGVLDRVEFLGHVAGSLKTSLIEACDMLVVPSSQENFGFVFFEALAAGLPVVTTDLVDTRDELAATGGVVIVSQNGAEVARGVRHVLDWRPDREIRMRQAREIVFRELATERVSRQFESMYESACSMP